MGDRVALPIFLCIRKKIPGAKMFGMREHAWESEYETDYDKFLKQKKKKTPAN